MIRKPAFAGPMRFYEGTADGLRAQIEQYVIADAQQTRALGAVSPHAGYAYSGRVAGELWSQVQIPETVVILAPNHRHIGESFAIWPDGAWLTPLGESLIDEDLTDAIVEAHPAVCKDSSAHLQEHSAEVQLPFLQYFRPDVSIVSIIVAERECARLERFGHALAGVIAETGRDILVLASSDMTHFETQATANKLDHMALERVLALDEVGLWEVVRRHRISMCGVAPTVAMLACVKRLGAAGARLVRYETSGDITGDTSEVVGYAGVMVN